MSVKMLSPKELAEAALRYHREPSPGKTGLQITKPAETNADLALAYSPGVASPCLRIEEAAEEAYNYTNKGNLVGVVSNGTAVLGLGNIGPLASKPVMEGKAMLFKKFAGLDAFDIEINAPSPEVFIETVTNISPTFGAINLEDIRAPECFFIEHRLRRRLDIPVLHDDQHGTAVVACAALINALELQNKSPKNMRVLVLGAGAAAVAISRLVISYFGISMRQILMFDSRGILSTQREAPIESYKMPFARDTRIRTLEAAVRVSDVVIGVSRGGLIKPEMLKKMRERPIILALANPVPEIMPADAREVRPDAIVATGRSDVENQVNNSLCFPYLFRGVLQARAPRFSSRIFFAAAKAIAALAREKGPDGLEFGPNYILPQQTDPRLMDFVVPAIVAAAKEPDDNISSAKTFGQGYE
ncbi:MAG: malic enzyme-like NAD(P)-binding protein [Gammaproteobacteria bacterium]